MATMSSTSHHFLERVIGNTQHDGNTRAVTSIQPIHDKQNNTLAGYHIYLTGRSDPAIFIGIDSPSYETYAPIISAILEDNTIDKKEPKQWEFEERNSASPSAEPPPSSPYRLLEQGIGHRVSDGSFQLATAIRPHTNQQNQVTGYDIYLSHKDQPSLHIGTHSKAYEQDSSLIRVLLEDDKIEKKPALQKISKEVATPEAPPPSLNPIELAGTAPMVVPELERIMGPNSRLVIAAGPSII